MSRTDEVRIRQAEPSDVDAVTDLLIAAMPADRDWWDYRFARRDQYPEEHRALFRLLIETWISPEFVDVVVMLAEVYDTSTESWQIGAYSAWDVAYVSRRKHGSAYQPRSGMFSCSLPASDVNIGYPLRLIFRELVSAVKDAAGAATRRDADLARMIEHSRAADESHAQFLDPLYGTEQVCTAYLIPLHIPILEQILY